MSEVRRQARKGSSERHVLICEDDLDSQILIAVHLRRRFDPHGNVRFSFASGAMAAVGVASWCDVDLILLDNDIPDETGAELMGWLRGTGRQIPVITFSSVEDDGSLDRLGADLSFKKKDFLSGHADQVIREILKL